MTFRKGEAVDWNDNGNLQSGHVENFERVVRNDGDVVPCLIVLMRGSLSARAWRLIAESQVVHAAKK
jgi:hypothetical protein